MTGFKELAAKIRNLFCVSDFQKRYNGDDRIQVKTHNGKVLEKNEAFPYGLYAKAKSGKALIFCQGGNFDNFEILPVLKDGPVFRPALEDGDAALYTGEGSYIIERETGELEIYTRQNGDIKIFCVGDYEERTDGNKKLVLGGNLKNEIAGSMETVVQGAITTQSNAAIATEAAAGISTKAGAAISAVAGGALSQKAGAAIDITAALAVAIQAGAAITLTAGGAIALVSAGASAPVSINGNTKSLVTFGELNGELQRIWAALKNHRHEVTIETGDSGPGGSAPAQSSAYTTGTSPELAGMNLDVSAAATQTVKVGG
jgi:phage gp45-like